MYLSPRDYHRVHMPWTAPCVRPCTCRGRLFSVGPAAVNGVPRLFARNERLVCHFDTSFGPMVSVMVGALLVSGVETVWSGEEIPHYGDRITRKDYRGQGISWSASPRWHASTMARRDRAAAAGRGRIRPAAGRRKPGTAGPGPGEAALIKKGTEGIKSFMHKRLNPLRSPFPHGMPASGRHYR